MRLRTISRTNLARHALALVWILVGAAMTAAGGDLVRIVSPKNGARVKGKIRVEARTPVEDAAYMIFCVDDRRPHSTNLQPYVYELDTTSLADGPHALAAELYGRGGLMAQSSPVMIQVANTPESPAPMALAAQPAAPATQPVSVKALAAPAAAPSPEQTAPQAKPQQASVITPLALPLRATTPPSVAPPALLPGPAPAVLAQTKEIAAEPPFLTASAQSPLLSVHPKTALPGTGLVAALRGERGASALTVLLDGRALEFPVAPKLADGRAHGALRTVIEQSGGAVTWIADTKQAVARRAGSRLDVTIGVRTAKLDGRAVDLGTAPWLTSGRTMVALRPACEPLGLSVAWSQDLHTVLLASSPAPMQMGMAPAK